MRIISKTQKTIAISFVLLLLSFIAINCIESPLEPVAPSSDIQLSIPMIETTHTAGEFIQNSPSLVLNSDGTYSYITAQNGDPVPIQKIEAQPEPSQQQVVLGPFEISAIPPTSQSMTIGDMGIDTITYPGAGSILPGVPPPFPTRIVSIPGNTLDFSSQFGFIRIKSGIMFLSITNNLPLKISFNKSVILRNNTLDNTSIVAEFPVGEIDSFQTKQIQSELNGDLLYGNLKIDSISFTTAERSDAFSLKSSHGIGFQFTSTPMLADSASAIIPDQTITSIEDSIFVVDDTIAVKEALFRQGGFNIVLTNQLDIQVGVNVSFDEIFSTRTGNNLNLIKTLDPKSINPIAVSFDTLRIFTNSLNRLGTNLTYSVGIKTITSKGEKRTVTANDFVKAEIQPLGKVVVQSVKGNIPEMDLPVNVKMKSNFESVAELQDKLTAEFIFKGIKINMHLPVTGGFPADYNLTFIAKNSKKNHIDSIIIPATGEGIRRIYPNQNKTTITITNAPNFDTFLGRFFPDLPDSFYVRGNVVINPWDNKQPPALDYTITDTAKVYPSFDIDFPSFVGIKNGRMKDVIDLKGAGKVPEEFSKNVKSAQVSFVFGNRIPFDMGFKLRFIGNKNNRRDTLLYIDPSNTIKAAKISSDSTANDTTVSHVVITMDPNVVDARSGLNQVAGFNAADSLVLFLNFETSNNGSAVKLRSNDYIKIRASVNSVYTLNKQ